MILDAVFYLLHAVLDLFWWAVIITVVVQLLIQFGVLDTRNRFVWSVADFLFRITEPVFRRVRIPAAADVDSRRVRDLSGDIALKPGELRIEFFGAEDLAAKLFELSQAMAND